jgi:hypothetical protein
VTVRRIITGLVVVMVIGACGVESDETADVQSPSPSNEGFEPSPSATPTSEPPIELDIPEPSYVEEQVLADLAARLEVATEEIEVAKVETGVWADGSIGCPEEGMMYTQALVPGTRVTLSHGGTTYTYHQGGSGEPFLCDSPVEDAFKGVEGDTLIPPPGYND